MSALRKIDCLLAGDRDRPFGDSWARASSRRSLTGQLRSLAMPRATLVAVTLLGRTDFVAFAAVLLLVQTPVLLLAVALYRRWTALRSHPERTESFDRFSSAEPIPGRRAPHVSNLRILLRIG
jgi:hypothetical protein